jgi:sugar-specific transcriptional regulator TrmB
MHLFEKKDRISIPIHCKVCLEEILFNVTKREYEKANHFPIVKESTHGDPKHRLKVFINKKLEIEDFTIDHQLETDSKEIPQDIIDTVLTNIGLKKEEIELYFLTVGRDIISVGEMALILNKPKEKCDEIAQKFVKKGLYKKIIGKTPHYAPLPPYAALSGKLKELQKNISNVKENVILIRKLSSDLNKTLEELEAKEEMGEKTEDISKIMFNIKNEVLENIQIKNINPEVQIKEIPEEIGNIDDYTSEIMQSQISVIKDQFKDINAKSIQIIQAQIAELNDKIDEMQEIISDNLKKLRLGVLEQSISNSVEKIVMNTLKEIQDEIDVRLSVNEMVFNDELNDFIEKFDQEFVDKFKMKIAQTIKKIDNIELDVKYDQQEIIQNITAQFNKSLQTAEGKITEICSNNIKSLAGVKGLLTKNIEHQIEETINEILDQLQIQEKMTNYFWEQAKKQASLSMQNVWFIHSIEAAKAHIIEETSRAKSRILIVAPKITDIDIDSIQSCPSHVNIRIAAFSDEKLPEHTKILTILHGMGNVNYRNRQLQNLWGINKDYEEVILCVLSKELIKEREIVELAGVGSIIEEHIKIFVPILEEAWMGAEKQDFKLTEKIPIDPLKQIKELRKKARSALEKGQLEESHGYFGKIKNLIQ